MLDLVIAANYRIHPSLWGGMDTFFEKMYGLFVEKGLKLRIVLPQTKDSNNEHYLLRNIPVTMLEGELFFKSLIEFTEKNPAKIVHTHFLPTLDRHFVNLSKYNRKIITTEHISRPVGGWNLKKRIKNKLISYYVRDHIDIMIHVSKYLETENRCQYGEWIKEKSKVIYNGIETRNDIPVEKDHKANRIKLISAGRLVNEKGFDRLVEIAHILEKKYPDMIETHILGDGPERKSLEANAANLLNKSIYFHGFVNNVQEFMRKSNLYVHTSSQEAFPFVFLEAFEAGLPVIAYDIGGNSEAIIDGFNGYLVEYESDIQNFVKQLEAVIFGKNIQSVGKNARIFVENAFPIEKTVNEYYEVYRKYL